ncbi:hypothetical protein [Rhizohabitans arisaemae]|uniref:hypothetical protein n=1 Tax=Rhizohabitans arisaemae TaxID=2720610 RepID=UPI0024B0E1D2|nr:hypothetical protein [Rhizohabitans arisaemae]
MPDNPTSPVVRNAAPIQTSVIWGSDRFLVSTPDVWVNLPNATIPQQVGVGGGSPSIGALFVAIFSAESLVKVQGDNGICWLDITFGGQDPHPESDNHRFDSSINLGTEWRSVSTTRIMEIPPTIPLVNATAQVRVKYSGGTLVECGLQNWSLTLFRYA